MHPSRRDCGNNLALYSHSFYSGIWFCITSPANSSVKIIRTVASWLNPPMATTDYSLERGLPVSMEAERSILGAILLDNSLYDQAAEHLTPDDFSLDAHRRIYSRMRDLQETGRPVDMITLVEELDRRKEVEAIGGVAYLSSLIDGVPERPSIEHYVRIVRNKALLRGLINVAQNAIAEAIEHSDEAEEVLGRAEQAIFQLSENRIG